MNCQCTCACKRREKPVSTTSPLAIEMLIHLCCKAGPFINRPFQEWPPAQRSIIDQWRRRALVTLAPPGDSRLFILTIHGERYARRVIDAAKGAMV